MKLKLSMWKKNLKNYLIDKENANIEQDASNINIANRKNCRFKWKNQENKRESYYIYSKTLDETDTDVLKQST